MEIPSRYNPKEIEPRILKQWLENKAFSAKTGSRSNYSIVIPPPNITGILHMGHGLNTTIQDVLIRFRRMQGYQALWMPGTDHAGIATQNVVERALAKKGLQKETIGRDKFVKKLWDWQERYGSTIIEQLKKLGASCDWQRLRFTLDSGYSQAVNEVFVKLYQKGLIYQGNYIINWCPRCKTALSDEEAAHKEIDGWLYYIKYPVRSKKALPPDKKYIVVATTRPETMLGDTAVAINPKDKRYSWLKNLKVILPIVARELPVIKDNAVDPEFGTGIVKVTPAHDPADFAMGKKYGLEFVNIMNEDATLNTNVPNDFIGQDRFEAREALLTLLEDKKLIVKKEPYSISAGHCYRCHTIIEPRISLQWFVKMKPLAKVAIKVVEKDKVKFYPPRWKKVYLNWMYNIQDWCISRQIWWGHRLPVWYCLDCRKNADNQVHAGVIVAKIAPKICPKCGSTNLSQDKDVLDTWFSSWLWPFATFGWPRETEELKYFYPTNCLVTASEILFFWVARMIMASLEFTKQIPFNHVLIHGTVRDEGGVKMSKSLGNTIDPLEIIDKFGADALRFSLMLLAASGSDVYLNKEKFLVGRNFANKIWNATRFILLKIKDSNFTVSDLELSNLDLVDGWVITELNITISETTAHLNKYALNEATKKIYDFFWHVYCDWYIEITKDNFTQDKAKVLIYVLINSVKLLHPLMPFITEEILSIIKEYTGLSLDKTMTKAAWPKGEKVDTKGIELVEKLIETVQAVRNIKVVLGMGTQKVGLQICAKDAYVRFLEINKSWLERLTSSKFVTIINKNKGENLERVLSDFCLWEINLAIEDFDRDSYISSLDKKITKKENIFSRTKQRLTNEGFLRNAPEAEKEKERSKGGSLKLEIKMLKNLRDAFKK